MGKYFPMKRTLLPWPFALALILLGAPAQAQVALPTPPAQPAAPAILPEETYLLGRTYEVDTQQGTSFTGRLVSLSLTTLEFNAAELGSIRLDRTQIRRADLQRVTKVDVKPGYYDIGNGNRLFFAPTGRGLRKGEATLQDVSVYLLGLNYGITDNFSLGGYVSLVPGVALSDQLLVLTPKFSFPVSEKVHVGAGLLYVRLPTFDRNSSSNSVGAGIGYGAITYGSADDNVTFGLGYGFVQGDIGSTPIIQVGGQKRVSRKISLISENYIVANSRGGLGGLYGIKINWRRTSLGLGAAYAYIFGYDKTNTYTYYDNNGVPTTTTQTQYVDGGGGSTYIVPVYCDFTFRFGKVK